MLRPFINFLIIGFLVFAFNRTTRAADGTVGNGTPASCTFAELQDEISAGGNISFSCGVYPITITLDSELAITTDTSLSGREDRAIILSGANAHRIFTITTLGNTPITVSIGGLTLANGRAAGSNESANGAAILVRNQSINQAALPTLNIYDVTFTNNVSDLTSFSGAGINAYDFGGAIYASGGVVNIWRGYFENNAADNAAGGAIHILRSNLYIEDSVFTDNSAIGDVPANSLGGAIYIDGLRPTDGSLMITGSIFDGNTSYNSGGAIHVNLYENNAPFNLIRNRFTNNAVIGGTRAQGGAIGGGGTSIGAGMGNPEFNIIRSEFTNNSVRSSGSPGDGSGGALAFPQRARITIANSNFTENTAHGTSFNANGGAIYIVNNTDQFEIINSTIADNHAGWVGGGVVNSALPSSNMPGGIIRNTIFANNTADNGTNDWDIQQHCGAIVITNGVSVIPPLVNGGNNMQYPNRNPNPNFWNETICAAGITIADPKLQPDPIGYRYLAPDSPAIDAGSNAVCAADPINNEDIFAIGIRPLEGDGISPTACDLGPIEYITDGLPLAPTLTSPTPGATVTTNTPTFTWQPSAFADNYRLQVDNDTGFGSPEIDVEISDTSYAANNLSFGTYSWHVTAINENGTAFSTISTFTIVSAPDDTPILNFANSLNVTLHWGAVTWTKGYWIQVDDSFPFYEPYVVDTLTESDQNSLNITLPREGIYYWRVCGRPVLSPFVCGAWSETQTIVMDTH